VENLVFNALRTKYKDIYYWKSKSGSEIDFLIRHKGTMTAVNVCYSDSIPDREYVGFTHLSKENINPIRNVLISKHISDTVIKDGTTIEVIPIWEFLSINLC